MHRFVYGTGFEAYICATISSLMVNERHPLPEHLKPLFWEYDFGRLRWPEHRDTVIAKILAYGDWDATHWLVEQIGRKGVRDWISNRRGNGLDARTLRFWELVAGLQHKNVDGWLRERAGLPWTERVPH